MADHASRFSLEGKAALVTGAVTERRRVGRCDKGMAGRRGGRIPHSSPKVASRLPSTL